MRDSVWSPHQAPRPAGQGPAASDSATAEELLAEVARGDEAAFERLYPLVAGPVWGVVRRVVRDPAQSEEVAQEALVELWRTAARFNPAKGSALSWAVTLAHRRAVDRVRHAQAGIQREARVEAESIDRDFDQVAETVTANLDREQVRRCLGSLTPLQRESIVLAYYGGRTYSDVAQLLHTPLGTVKTRLRDGLIRLRDCLGES
jgi:RNA polymerase sigma-70 factor, ECF subfamily